MISFSEKEGVRKGGCRREGVRKGGCRRDGRRYLNSIYYNMREGNFFTGEHLSEFKKK